MAITKVGFYISVILVVCLVALGLMHVGTDFYNSPRMNLTPESKTYIEGYSETTVDAGLNTVYSKSTEELKKENILEGDNSSTIDTSTGEIGVRNADKGTVSRTVSFFNIVYNIPSFIARGLNLPTDGIKDYVNIIVYVLFIGIVITIYLLVKGVAK